jgi:hypothetical protein
MLFVASVSASARPAARAGGVCRVPRLTRLTLAAARKRAAHAGCTLRVKGAKPEQPSIQTVERQSPAGGAHASRVTVWLNPLCFASTAHGPEVEEPILTPGLTELISGFYLDGGPLQRFSAPDCRRPAPPPQAGTVEVSNPATGAVVATQTSADGKFAEIPLPAGSYTIVGTFLDDTDNGGHPKVSESVTIPPGHTVRQDFFLNVP